MLIVSEDLGILKMAYTVDFAQDEFRKTAKISALYDRDLYVRWNLFKYAIRFYTKIGKTKHMLGYH